MKMKNKINSSYNNSNKIEFKIFHAFIIVPSLDILPFA